MLSFVIKLYRLHDLHRITTWYIEVIELLVKRFEVKCTPFLYISLVHNFVIEISYK